MMSIDDHKILLGLTGHRSDVTSCDFASDFTLITGSSDKTVRIWEWTPGAGYVERPNSPLREHKYQVTCVRVSPQGTMFASASVDGTAVLWNLSAGTKLYGLVQVNGDAVRVCRFAPDSSVLVTGGDNGAVCVWDLVHRGLIRALLQHEGTTQSLAFTADSQYLVSACSLEVVRVWYVQDLVDTAGDAKCTPVARIDNAHDLGVFGVDVNKAIRVDENNPLTKYYTMATCGNSNEIKIWTISSTSTLKSKNCRNEVGFEFSDSYDGHNSSVTCVRYSPTGRFLVSSSLDKTIKIWDSDSGDCVATLTGHTRYVNCVAISKDTLLIASGSTGSNDKMILIWDLTGGLDTNSELFKPRHLSISNEHNGAIPESQLIAENGDNEVKLIEKIDDISEGAINACCFNHEDILATGSGDKLVRLFKVFGENNNVDELNISPLEGHTYAVNHVDFVKNGSILASCSLDGCTNIWDVNTGEKVTSLPQNGLAIKICKFSPNGDFLITAGDDEKATVWNPHSGEKIKVLEGHLDAITSASFTPDNKMIATVSSNSDFRLWKCENFENVHTHEDVHGGGVQFCDFSENSDPIPNALFDLRSYLLATCGNDSLVKLWRISVDKNGDLGVKMWRSLQGHGGNVTYVRFSPSVGEVLCSAATDRQARIWSVYSSECLHVLDHDSIVTSCCFSSNCSLLAVGCIDKTLWLWKLPQQLVFQTIIADKIKTRTKTLVDWTTADVVKWLKKIDLEEITQNVENSSLDGQKIVTLTEEQICSGLDLDDNSTNRLKKELKWLKQDELYSTDSTSRGMMSTREIPYEFLCPITHEIMREPVTCCDQYTYERKAIAEWFMSGKYTSPLTNEVLLNTEYTYNRELKSAIHSFLYEENEE